jgi:hypothetical protein
MKLRAGGHSSLIAIFAALSICLGAWVYTTGAIGPTNGAPSVDNNTPPSRPLSLSANSRPAVAAAAPSPVVSVKADGLVTLASTGAQIQLASSGACMVANDAVLKDASKIIPTGCVEAPGTTTAASSDGMGSQLISWNTTTVVYGAVPSSVAQVSLIDAGSVRYATVLQPAGAGWRVFYFVLPFKPYDVTDAATGRTHYQLTAADSAGKTIFATS